MGTVRQAPADIARCPVALVLVGRLDSHNNQRALDCCMLHGQSCSEAALPRVSPDVHAGHRRQAWPLLCRSMKRGVGGDCSPVRMQVPGGSSSLGSIYAHRLASGPCEASFGSSIIHPSACICTDLIRTDTAPYTAAFPSRSSLKAHDPPYGPANVHSMPVRQRRDSCHPARNYF